MRVIGYALSPTSMGKDHPTLWVSYCGKFRVIANAKGTGFHSRDFPIIVPTFIVIQ
jgi:hypothetical protein